MVDGGIYSDLNLQDAIHKCREVTDKDENIIVDVIMCNSDPVFIQNYTKWNYFNAWNIHQRTKDFKTFYTVLNDVLPMADMNPDVNFRYVVTATESLPGGAVPIFAKPSDLEDTYKIGYADGMKAIKHDESYKQYSDMVQDYQYFTTRDGFD